MNNLSLEILDGVLQMVSEYTSDEPIDLVIELKMKANLGNRDVKIIVEKLEKEEMIASLIPYKDTDTYDLHHGKYMQGMKYYYSTFNGIMLLKKGGYAGEYKRQVISTNLQSVQTWAIVFGTLIAAYGSVGLLYFEYVKHNHHYYNGINLKELFSLISVLLILVLAMSWNRLKIQNGKTHGRR